MMTFDISLGRLDEPQEHRWPGNVRELRNLMERLVILVQGDEIGLSDLSEAMQREGGAGAEPVRQFTSLREGREDFERRFIMMKLQEAGGNVVQAAELLGLERSNLYRKMRAYRIRGGEAES